MSHGENGNGGQKIVLTPAGLGVLITTILGLGGGGMYAINARASQAPAQSSPTYQQDHDAITNLNADMRAIKDDIKSLKYDTRQRLDRIEQRTDDTNTLVRQLVVKR